MRVARGKYSPGQGVWFSDYYLCKNVYHLHYSDCASCQCCKVQCILDWHLVPQNRVPAPPFCFFHSPLPHPSSFNLLDSISFYAVCPNVAYYPKGFNPLPPSGLIILSNANGYTYTVIPHIYFVGGSETGEISRNIFSHKCNVKKGRVVLDNLFWPEKTKDINGHEPFSKNTKRQTNNNSRRKQFPLKCVRVNCLISNAQQCRWRCKSPYLKKSVTAVWQNKGFFRSSKIFSIGSKCPHNSLSSSARCSFESMSWNAVIPAAVNYKTVRFRLWFLTFLSFFKSTLPSNFNKKAGPDHVSWATRRQLQHGGQMTYVW